MAIKPIFTLILLLGLSYNLKKAFSIYNKTMKPKQSLSNSRAKIQSIQKEKISVSKKRNSDNTRMPIEVAYE